MNREYGLLDNPALQAHLLALCEQGGLTWRTGLAAGLEHFPTHSLLTTQDGQTFSARLVIDASGHKPVFVRRRSGPSSRLIRPPMGWWGRFPLRLSGRGRWS